MLGALWGCATSPVDAATEALPYYQERTFTPHWMARTDVPESFHRIGEFTLTDQHSEEITQAVMDDRITVASFFFTQCGGICPKLTRSLKTVDAALPREDVVLLTHSVMPSSDTVPALKRFVAKYEIDSDRWHVLTGDRSTIYHLGRHGYFAEEDLGEERDDDDFLHTENLVLVDGDRRLRGIYNGLNATSVQQLVDDATQLAATLR